jgi:diacylglycerol kinase (ATP)
MATRVTLLHNSGAGFENFSTEQLLQALRKQGYDPTYEPTFVDDFSESLQDPGDLVIIAGGDGTVGKIAPHLVGRGIPVGLLPLGTANNIATSLGISGEPAAIIGAWDLSSSKSYDVGVINGPEGKTFFFESVGFGLFPRLIRQREEDDPKDSRQEELKDALKHQMEILAQYPSHPGTIEIDGQAFAGNFLMVEIMNLPMAGPNMDLAPAADPGDGLLDVVMVRENEREKFAQFLICCLRGEPNENKLEVRRGKKIRVVWESEHYHVDDEAHKAVAPVKINIELLAKGLEFLTSPAGKAE